MQEHIARLRWLAVFLGAVWAVQVVNWLTGYSLNRWFGLEPRDLGGLIGIPLMPLLHGSAMHAAANTLPIIIFGLLMALTAPNRVYIVSSLIIALGGLGVWMFGRNALHVGASGLIFGWFAFLIARGYVERSFSSVAIALGVAVFYGALIWGVLPLDRRVSWEAHLFGALAGVACAFLFRREPASGTEL